MKPESEGGLTKPSLEDGVNFWENEFFTFTIYCPDLRKIVQNKVKIAVGKGVKSGDAFYAKATIKQAETLGCRNLEFPGHHGGFESFSEEFAAVLKKAFRDMAEKSQ